MAQATTNTSKTDVAVIFVSVLGLVVAFLNIYKFAHNRQPADAVWAGVVIFALSFTLATQLAKMRKA